MLSDEEIGGGRVCRWFRYRDIDYPSKRHLTRAEVMALPIRNRQALIRSGFLKVYPRRIDSHAPAIEARAANISGGVELG
jgi:hypothetical protein